MVTVRGAVQGVGFRPFIYRLAASHRLNGWVTNSTRGVLIEVEGKRPKLNEFLLQLERQKPPRAIIQSMEFSFLEPAGHEGFKILPSDDHGDKSAFILPDIAPCADCLKELFDAADRRYLYPFINCTNCGPRFSIIHALPYDRPNTSMAKFKMCERCAREYHDPMDRRFHAQPNACPDCGPQVTLLNRRGTVLASRHEALAGAAWAICDGLIVALKGVGGVQLLVDARNHAAVQRLRERKHREEKPFALMYPSLARLQNHCAVNEFEARLLSSAEAPIVLLEKRNASAGIADAVAPRNPCLGVMLPTSPLHHVLMRVLDFPVVATSGNLSSEPICINKSEALERLGEIADVFLTHDRPIARPVDDSVARVVFGREMILRRARGYAPLPIHCRETLPAILAVGPHLKNTVAISKGREVFISQHAGDLETEEAFHAFQKITADMQQLYDFTPELVACDLHPEYLSTKYARKLGVPVVEIQHHYAHVLSCMAENEVDGPALGVSWDGTGLGSDGTIWGGEFLRINDVRPEREDAPPFSRFAHLRQFCLPGGDKAIKQPCRTALGLLWEIFGEKLFARDDIISLRQFSPTELTMLRRMLENRVNAPRTSSAGRLFDAIASIAGLRQRTSFEGQAAMDLEYAAQRDVEESYHFSLSGQNPIIIEWQPIVLGILEDLNTKTAVDVLAAKFHNTLANIILEVAKKSEEANIVLSGGCFQNKFLLERTISKITEAGLKAFWHQRVPANDGGIALGQIAGAARAQAVHQKSAEASYA